MSYDVMANATVVKKKTRVKKREKWSK